MNVKPIGDRVLIKVQEGETQTKSGLFIPQTAQEKTQEGVIVAVGTDESITVKEKDKVLYEKYAGTGIKIDGTDHLILKMKEIIAIID
jgi:chaperonin GroES